MCFIMWRARLTSCCVTRFPFQLSPVFTLAFQLLFQSPESVSFHSSAPIPPLSSLPAVPAGWIIWAKVIVAFQFLKSLSFKTLMQDRRCSSFPAPTQRLVKRMKPYSLVSLQIQGLQTHLSTQWLLSVSFLSLSARFPIPGQDSKIPLFSSGPLPLSWWTCPYFIEKTESLWFYLFQIPAFPPTALNMLPSFFFPLSEDEISLHLTLSSLLPYPGQGSMMASSLSFCH